MSIETRNPVQEELSKQAWFIAGCRLSRREFNRLVRSKFQGPTRPKFIANSMVMYDRVQRDLRMSS